MVIRRAPTEQSAGLLRRRPPSVRVALLRSARTPSPTGGEGKKKAASEGGRKTSSGPLPRFDVDELDGHGGLARNLARDRLALDPRPVSQRQNDGTDHGHKQDHARGLEVEDVV